MKILHVTTGLGRGGAERMLVRVLRESVHRQAQCAVASMTGRGSYGDQVECLGVPLHTLGMRRGSPNPLGLIRLRRLIHIWNPEVIHGWMYHGALLSSFCSGKRPFIISIRHSIDDIRREKPQTRLVIRMLARRSGRASRVLYNSRISKLQHDMLGYHTERVSVIPNGFDTDFLKPDSNLRQKTRAELGVSDDQILILHAARHHPMKDHAGYLRAISGLWADPRLVFLLAGSGISADDRALASGLAGAPDERVRLLGEQSDVKRLMVASDLFCVSSAWGEAFPNVLGEAMACGLPCITTDVGDAADIVQDTGMIVPPGDPEALAGAIVRLASLGPENLRSLGKRAREVIVEKYGLDQVITAYFEMYDQILAETPA